MRPGSDDHDAARRSDHPKTRLAFRDNDLDGLSLELANFLDFYAKRKELMRKRLLKVLGVTSASPPAAYV